MSYNETRMRQSVGTCPACGVMLEVVLAIDLQPGSLHTDLEASPTNAVVDFTGKVVGAVTIAHDCMPKPAPKTRAARQMGTV